MMNPWPRSLWLRILVAAWSLPGAVLALVLVLVGIAASRGSRHRFVDGALEVVGMRRWPGTYLRKNGWTGFTCGWVTWLWEDMPAESTRYHERVHVRQGLVLGPFWLILYPIYRLVLGYEKNPFEIEARLKTSLWLASSTRVSIPLKPGEKDVE